METIPDDIKADGLKIIAKIDNMDMPLSEETIKKHCGHQPKTEIEAQVMAKRLKGRVLEFPNINMGKQTWKIKTFKGYKDNPEKRRERIERRKRRERDEMKVNIGVELEEEVKKHELCKKVLEIEDVKRVKKVSDSAIEIITKKAKEIDQKRAIDNIVKVLEEDFEEIKKVTSVDFAD